jgi:hypothetical protein
VWDSAAFSSIFLASSFSCSQSESTPAHTQVTQTVGRYRTKENKMDTPKMFLCTVVHPKLFPGPITDPGNPLRVKMLIEIGAEDLIIRASAASANGKIMGTEPLAKIERVIIEHLASSAQRIEILRRSLLRMAIVGGIILAFMLFIRAYSLGTSILIALVVAAIIGPLNFLLNGGLGGKQDMVRFCFEPSEHGHIFYLEVPPTQEPELHQALLAAGLNLEEPETNTGAEI